MSSRPNKKWGVQAYNDKPLYVVLFISRNKDNKATPKFKERRKSFLTSKTPNELQNEFNSFVNSGVSGEICRFYYSVNSRDPAKIRKQLIHFLIDNEDFNLTSLDSKIAGIAAKKECAAEAKWLFDFDCTDKDKLQEFIDEIKMTNSTVEIEEINATPNGYHIVTNHGFDTRALMLKWKDIISLKRDDMKFICTTMLF